MASSPSDSNAAGVPPPSPPVPPASKPGSITTAWVDGTLLRRISKRILTPGEMEQFPLRREELPAGCRNITFTVEEVAK